MPKDIKLGKVQLYKMIHLRKIFHQFILEFRLKNRRIMKFSFSKIKT